MNSQKSHTNRNYYTFYIQVPLEHNLAAYTVHINRMITLPITQQAKQQEWNIILTIPRNNGFPLQIIHNLKNKLMLVTQQTTAIPTQTQLKKNWVTFTYESPLIHKVTNLFKHTNLNLAF